MKICACCKQSKEPSEFSVNKRSSDGLHYYCKACCKLKRNSVPKHVKLAYQKKYRENNREKLRQDNVIYKETHKETRQATLRNYRSKNRDVIVEKKRVSFKKNYRTNTKFKMECLLRTRLQGLIRSGLAKKKSNTLSLIGCTVDELIKYIESKFKPGMSWENHGEWHLDHILPCASFNLNILSEQIKCFNYKNLQPLWKSENLLKSDKILPFDK